MYRRHSRVSFSAKSGPSSSGSFPASRRERRTSFPSSSIASRSAYFRSPDTPNACRWLFSSSSSASDVPESGISDSRSSSAAVACSVGISRRPRISPQSNRSSRFWAHLPRSISSVCPHDSNRTQRGARSCRNILRVMISSQVSESSARSGGASPRNWSAWGFRVSGSISSASAS